MKHITSHDNPFFKELLKLASSARQRREAGQTLLDGVHLLQACVAAALQPLHVLVTEAALRDPEITAAVEALPNVPLTQLDDKLFAALSDLKTPSGILALISQPSPKIAIADSRFALFLEDIQDPGNLGSMLRSAAAAGCDAVFLSQGCADVWSPKVLRGGMGGHFALSLHQAADLPALAAIYPGKVYAAVPDAKPSVYACDLRGNVAFAIGNEGAGLGAGMLGFSQRLCIPMSAGVESLNAAAAAAVCLFEAVRQRSQQGTEPLITNI